mmetsp:Transcript_25102/g.79215  ORF Transcript_25102/g.79215 Transcript_25102/m.79215 type:complete len:496 (-) Transcript_25102:1608-3095(-)
MAQARGTPATPLLTLCDIVNGELRVAWWQPPAAAVVAETTEWAVEWRAPHWWRARRSRIVRPAAPKTAVKVEPPVAALAVRVQAFAGRRASGWSQSGRAAAGRLVAASVGCDGGGGVVLLLRAVCIGGAGGRASAAGGEVEPAVPWPAAAVGPSLTLSLRVDGGGAPAGVASVRALVRIGERAGPVLPARALPVRPPAPAPMVMEVLITLTVEEADEGGFGRARGVSGGGGRGGGVGGCGGELSEAMLSFIGPTVASAAAGVGDAPGAGRGGVRVWVGMALVLRPAGDRACRGGAVWSDRAVVKHVASGSSLVGMVHGVVGGVVGGVSGLRDGVVGGVASLAELATTATSWSLDTAHAWTHALTAGGRRDVIREVESARGPMLPPPPPAEHDACAACLRIVAAAAAAAEPATPSSLPATVPASTAGQVAVAAAAGHEAARFALRRRRHHCRHCGGSFCADHLRWRHRLDPQVYRGGPGAAAGVRGLCAGAGAGGL